MIPQNLTKSAALSAIALFLISVLFHGEPASAATDPTGGAYASLPPAIAVGAATGKAPYLGDGCDEVDAWVQAYEICKERFPGLDLDSLAPYSWSVDADCEVSDVMCYTIDCGEGSRPGGLTTVNGTVVYPPGTRNNPQPLKVGLADDLGGGVIDTVEGVRKWRESWWNWLWGQSPKTPDEEEEDDTGEDDKPEDDGFVPGDGGCFPFPTGR